MKNQESPSYSDAVILVDKHSPAIKELVLSIVDDMYTKIPLETHFKRLNRNMYQTTDFSLMWSTLVGSLLLELIYLELMDEGLNASVKYGKEFMKGEDQ